MMGIILCIRALEAALERRTVEWQAALAERSIAHAAAEERQQAGLAAAAERDAQAQACIQALTQQLERSNDNLLQVGAPTAAVAGVNPTTVLPCHAVTVLGRVRPCCGALNRVWHLRCR